MINLDKFTHDGILLGLVRESMERSKIVSGRPRLIRWQIVKYLGFDVKYNLTISNASNVSNYKYEDAVIVAKLYPRIASQFKDFLEPKLAESLNPLQADYLADTNPDPDLAAAAFSQLKKELKKQASSIGNALEFIDDYKFAIAAGAFGLLILGVGVSSGSRVGGAIKGAGKLIKSA